MEQPLTDGPPHRACSRIIPGGKVILIVMIGILMLFLVGCSVRSNRPSGIYHRVKSGETLSAIARAYNVRLQDLAEVNNISKPDQIEADSVLFIPDATQILDDVITAARSQTSRAEKPPDDPREKEARQEAAPAVPQKDPPKKETVTEPSRLREKAPVDMTAKDRTALSRGKDREKAAPGQAGKTEETESIDKTVKKKEVGEKTEEIQFDKERFIWPVKGKVISTFGIQPNKMNFNGVRIAAAEEAAVQAAAGGTVIFSAPLKEYGETIIIRHEDQYATVYTHLGTRTVRGDARVKKGDRIAFLGKSDSKEGPYLYFEIRHKNKARNPLFFLP